MFTKSFATFLEGKKRKFLMGVVAQTDMILIYFKSVRLFFTQTHTQQISAKHEKKQLTMLKNKLLVFLSKLLFPMPPFSKWQFQPYNVQGKKFSGLLLSLSQSSQLILSKMVQLYTEYTHISGQFSPLQLLLVCFKPPSPLTLL